MALTLTERPQTFDEVKGHEEVVENLRTQFKTRKFSHFYMLEGNRGSGKTTIGRIIAKAVNCLNPDDRGNPCCKCSACVQIQDGNSPDYSELDAASNNGVDSTRALIDATNYVPMNLKYKVMLIDEAHMLTTAAFNAFLKTLEEPPEYCIFIMATTDVNKIPITVQSRAMIYQFKRISVDVIKEHVISVAKKYDVSIEPDAAAIIAKKATGAMRDALSDLEKCLLVGDTITVSDVMEVCGIADTERLLSLVECLCDYERMGAFSQIEELYTEGRDLKYCVSECLNILTDIIKYKNSKDDHILCQTEAYNEKVVQLAERTANARLSSVADGLMQLKTELSADPSRNNVLIHISKMCEQALDVSFLYEKIRQLEAIVGGIKESGIIPAEPRKAEGIGETTVEQTSKPSASKQSAEPEQPAKAEEQDSKTTVEGNPQQETEKMPEKEDTKEPESNVVSSGNGMYHFDFNGKKKKKPEEKVSEEPKKKKPIPEQQSAFFGSFSGQPANTDGFEKTEDTPFAEKECEETAENVSETVPSQEPVQAVTQEPVCEDMQEPEPETTPEPKVDTVDDLLVDDVIRHAVDNYCTVEQKEGETIISSSFAPIVRIVASYIAMYQLNGIVAKVHQ